MNKTLILIKGRLCVVDADISHLHDKPTREIQDYISVQMILWHFASRSEVRRFFTEEQSPFIHSKHDRMPTEKP